MITVILLYFVALLYLSVFLCSLELSGLLLQPRSNFAIENYQVIYIVNQFTMYAALFFFMHVYVGYYF